MDAASVVQLRRTNDSRARVLEISAQLRAAVTDGDDQGIARLLSDLLRFRGSSRAQRTRLQLRALQGLIYMLRSATLTDEMTGLHNRRGFLQNATRLLDVAVRERCPHRLVYIHLNPQADAPAAPMLVLRQTGNVLRDLFPDYGVYEALGRLGANEFAALTPRVEYLSCDSILRPISAPLAGNGGPRTRPAVGIAHFDPLRPVGINELLASAQQAPLAREPLTRVASSALSPPRRNDASLTVSERRQRVSCRD